jgi:hypothetical protein
MKILDGKWDITFEDWPWSTYPSYLGGPAYLIHGSAILTLLAAGQTTPMTPFEDLYVTGICAEKSGLHIYISTNSTRLICFMIKPSRLDIKFITFF